MSDKSISSMTLQGVATGLTMNLTAESGIVRKSASVTASSGYDIAQAETGEGLTYDVVSIADGGTDDDPPSITVSVAYSQTETVGELDLDVRFTDIPAGTELAVEASKAQFSISRQEIEGSSLIGSSGKDVAPFDMTAAIKLWISAPEDIRKSSGLVMVLSKIDSSGGGPVKKVVLQQIAVNLANT